MDFSTVNGIVLSSTPMGEVDRRLCLLTLEHGKISAFARGARRPKSSLMASSRPFTMATWTVHEGRDSYTVSSGEVKAYFSELAMDPQKACLGYFLLELTEYYTRENADESVVLRLLYRALRALENPKISDELVSAVFQLKLMILNGDFLERETEKLSDACRYAVEYLIENPPEKVFSFALPPEKEKELSEFAKKNRERFVERELRSLSILHEVSQNSF